MHNKNEEKKKKKKKRQDKEKQNKKERSIRDAQKKMIMTLKHLLSILAFAGFQESIFWF